MPRTVIGCDLSRAFLDFHALPDGRPRRVENTGAAIAAWAETLALDPSSSSRLPAGATGR